MAPVSTPAILLRSHPFGETSRILRFYTRGHGLLAVMARGVRTRSGKGMATLETFASGELTAFVKAQRDLHTMQDFSCVRTRSALGGSVLRFAAASAVAEIVVSHADQGPHPEVFDALARALDALEETPPEGVASACLCGAWGVVAAFGFAPELEACIQCGNPFGPEEIARFDSAAGGALCQVCGASAQGRRLGPGARVQLRAFLGRAPEASSLPVTRARQHVRLLADFVSFHLASRPVRSLAFLGDLLPADEEG